MRKILGFLLGVYSWMNAHFVCAADKFEVLPDLPEPLASAQASSVSNTSDSIGLATQSVGQEPNILTMITSLIAVILMIYAASIIYSRLNKFNLKTLGKQLRETDNSKVSVVSTTPLGSNKTLHVVELDGKRLLIGASANGIHLIKDLGSYPPTEIEEAEYSKIEIPNIRIPKIEIPKIEFPNIGFTKAFKKSAKEEPEKTEEASQEDYNGFEISDIYEETPDCIIDRLFKTDTPNAEKEQGSVSAETENIQEAQSPKEYSHVIDPEEYALYKKYL